MLKKYALLACILALLPLVAAHASVEESLPDVARRLLTHIDSLAVKGIDRRYIGVPEKPWQVVLRGNVNKAALDMKSTINDNDIFDLFDGEMNSNYYIRSGLETYLGVWAGYRGYGIGYSRALGGSSEGSLLTLGMTGSCYGVNFRNHHFVTNECEIHDRGNVLGYTVDTTTVSVLASPIHVRSIILDGYYLFNGRRFSYSAAYDQSAYQLRSAGSFMLGGMYYYGHIDYAKPQNMGFIFMMDDVGQMRQWQASIGAGYAYNYVPVKGLLISGMLMPMTTVFNRLTTYRYDTLIKQLFLKDPTTDLDGLIGDGEEPNEEEGMWRDENRYKTTQMSHVTLNFNARASVTYNFGEHAYFNAYGQLYNFRFHHDNNRGNLTEWFVNAALGIRF